MMFPSCPVGGGIAAVSPVPSAPVSPLPQGCLCSHSRGCPLDSQCLSSNQLGKKPFDMDKPPPYPLHLPIFNH